MKQNTAPQNTTLAADESFEDYNISSTKINYNKKGRPSICWKCRYATGIPINTTSQTFDPKVCIQSRADHSKPQATPRPHRCPWIEKGEPVKGWRATPTELFTSNATPFRSYEVTACPLYDPDLAAQIDELSNEDVATYLSIPKSFVRQLPDETRIVLYKMIERWNEYTLIILDKVNQGRLRQASEIADSNYYHYAASLLLTDLPASPVSLPTKLRSLAIKELMLWAEIDYKEGNDLTALTFLNGLKELVRKIKKTQQAAQNKAIKESKHSGK